MFSSPNTFITFAGASFMGVLERRIGYSLRLYIKGWLGYYINQFNINVWLVD